MPHGIKEQDWIAFTDGTLDRAAVESIEAHLAVCAECAAIQADLARWRHRLSEEGREIRRAMELCDADMERMLSESLHRIGAVKNELPRRSAMESLALLRSLLEPVFGQGIVRAAIDRALGSRAPAGISAETWYSFIDSLSGAIQTVCGSAGGRLVSRAGASLAMEG